VGRLLASSMTSRDYDFIHVMSQSSKLTHLELGGPRLTIRVDPLSTHYRKTLC